jgi:hypothetical protein
MRLVVRGIDFTAQVTAQFLNAFSFTLGGLMALYLFLKVFP